DHSGAGIAGAKIEADCHRCLRHPDECAGQTIENGTDAFCEPAWRRPNRETAAILDRCRSGPADAICSEQSELSLLHFAEGTPDLISSRWQRAALPSAQYQ